MSTIELGGRATAAFAFMAAASFAISACSESSEPDDSSEQDQDVAVTPGETGDPESGNGELADPGATVGIGEEAVLPYRAGESADGVISLSVDEIETADQADLEELGKTGEAGAAYYIHFTATGVEGSQTLANSNFADYIYGVLGDGGEGEQVTPMGDAASFEPCPATVPGEGFIDGESHQGCAIAFAPEGEEVESAKYAFIWE